MGRIGRRVVSRKALPQRFLLATTAQQVFSAAYQSELAFISVYSRLKSKSNDLGSMEFFSNQAQINKCRALRSFSEVESISVNQWFKKSAYIRVNPRLKNEFKTHRHHCRHARRTETAYPRLVA
jgi:hypothetical protein